MSSSPLKKPFDKLLDPTQVLDAQARIAPYIDRTPIMRSDLLDAWLGHEVVFKVDALQRTGAFKIRGALNTLLQLREAGQLPEKLVAFSSGNHAIAVALAGELFRIDTTVIMPAFVSQVKQQAARSYGAKVILTETRPQAEALAASYAQAGAFFLHPSDHDSVIAGQGTLCLEALQDDAKPDAIFAACGGGGLLAGTLLAAQLAAPDACVYGCEPLQANDAARSVRQGSITGFDNTPPTIADGARTLRITPRTFSYLERLSGFYEIPERDIIYWTQWLQHLLKITIEPTAALAMAGAFAWLRGQTDKQRALVLISGGNVDAMTYERIWATSFLEQTPQL